MKYMCLLSFAKRNTERKYKKSVQSETYQGCGRKEWKGLRRSNTSLSKTFCTFGIM